MNTTLDYLFRVEPPWIYVGTGEPERLNWNPSHFYSRPDFNASVRRLRGRKMQTVQALMDEFSAALQFFDGFGENFYALEECLEYMDEWLPSDVYILVVENTEDLLRDENPDQISALLKTLHNAGEWWSKSIKDNDRFNRKGIPFHVLLNVSHSDPAAVTKFIGIAQGVGAPVRG